MPTQFVVPQLADNSDGWGPTTTPEQFKDIPYAPFSKGDKVGKASDWTGQGYKYGQGRFDRDRGVINSAFNFFANEDEDSFQLVDSKPAPRPKYGARRFQNRFQQNQYRPREESRRDSGRDSGAGADRERQRRERMQLQKRNQRNTYDNRTTARSNLASSVDIKAEWVVLEQLPLSAFSKLSFDVGEPEDIATCGALSYYDKVYDRITPKMEKPLEKVDSRQFHRVSTSDDPVIKRLASEDLGTVFATDSLLSTLMCAPRSVYSWDMVVQRVGNKLFLDHRDAAMDLLTVNETAVATEAMEDSSSSSMNSVVSLSQEATYINQSFSQQVLQKSGAKYEFKEPNPFAAEGEEREGASMAYRYRKWKLDDDTTLVARCALDCVMELRGQEVFAALHALNEVDPKMTGVDWRQKIENQRGAVLAAELKNNANKLAKWTAQAILAGAEVMKLGYVSRAHVRDNSNHVILGVQAYKPKEFAAQITLGVNNMWGILKAVVDMCMKLDEGKYLLVKDPNKPIVRLYEVPSDAFENDYAEEPIPEEDQAPPPAVEAKIDGKEGDLEV